MAKNKTTQTDDSVTAFLNSVADEAKRNDAFRLVELMQSQTGFEPRLWGASIVGFGSYHYRYDSGHEGDAPLVGFSPRKDAISLYLALNAEQRDELLPKFGKHKTGKGCIYIKKLADVNTGVFYEMIGASVENMKNRYPA
ncbi:DUF1801 domain-containing protein [Larkinella terrae]|uniref:DUF1801 domain-containing protein n=1 Tax=Larkinella terrae TaxID=2025311 RepID=A0A7K0EW36_9BACT|nr:DUF1801 domain-containing protein [Larkinella terrae]MRS65618.1 DUF1801 domain-containing protein [Larkinella terrae]